MKIKYYYNSVISQYLILATHQNKKYIFLKLKIFGIHPLSFYWIFFYKHEIALNIYCFENWPPEYAQKVIPLPPFFFNYVI